MKIIKLDQVDSTNRYLKTHYQSLQNFDVVYTSHQTNGIGRRHHQWFSDQDSLTFSILVKDTLTKDTRQLMPFYSAYILRQIIAQYVDNVCIKWPNDILINDKKVVGILTESIIQGEHIYYIIGIGLNLNQSVFPKNIHHIATSLKLTTNQTYQPFPFIKNIVNSYIEQFDHFKNNPQKILSYCNKHLAYKQNTITFTNQNKSIIGECIGINHKGHLVINLGDHLKTFMSGDIQYIRPYKTKE